MENAGVTLDDEKTAQLLAAVRTHTLKNRAALSQGELVHLYQHTLNGNSRSGSYQNQEAPPAISHQ
jgi:hypothetical protein